MLCKIAFLSYNWNASALIWNFKFYLFFILSIPYLTLTLVNFTNKIDFWNNNMLIYVNKYTVKYNVKTTTQDRK